MRKSETNNLMREYGANRLTANRLMSIWLFLIGLTMVLFFLSDAVLPLQSGVVLLTATTLWGLIRVKVTRLSLLPRLAIVTYSIVFSPTLGYLMDPDYIWRREYITILYSPDHVLMRHVLMIGLIGLLGLLAGIWLVTPPDDQSSKIMPISHAKVSKNTLDPIAFSVLLLVAFLLSWLFAPTASLFQAKYAAVGTAGRFKSLDFNSAGLVSYVILILLFVDAERTQSISDSGRWKLAAVFLVSAFIVIFFQFLRGNREAMGFVFGLMALYTTGPKVSSLKFRGMPIEWRRLIRLLLPGALIIALALVVGAVRTQLNDSQSRSSIDIGGAIVRGIERGTWGSPLKNIMGLTDEYLHGSMEYLYGETYLQYLQSLPPATFNKALEIERPLNSTGPYSWYRYTFSTISLVTVPFKNFGPLGTFIILGFFGSLLARWELASSRYSFWGRLIYGTVFVSLPAWFWYTDMGIIRGLMTAGLLGLIYKTWLTTFGRKTDCPIRVDVSSSGNVEIT